MDVDQTLRAIKVAEQFVETLAGGIGNVAKFGAFATGVGKGIWNLGKKALGAVAAAVKSNNPLVKKVSESTLESAATVKMSLKDLKDLIAMLNQIAQQLNFLASQTHRLAISQNFRLFKINVDGSKFKAQNGDRIFLVHSAQQSFHACQ